MPAQTSTRMPTRQEQQHQQQQRKPSHPIYANEGLSPKKTALIIVTVVGCIAILWPKVFYPMMFGGSAVATNKANMKEPHRGPGGIRQERPAHLHPDSVYQAMRERGRAIPATPTIPIVERKTSPSNPPPRIVEGRPGPIPGMRPPMGAGAMHQPQAKGNQSVGILMPLYTIGIVIFFGYTIVKIVFKKPVPNAPYGPAPSDPNFRKDVFGHENGRHVEDLNGSKLGTKYPDSLHQQQQHRNKASDLYNATLSGQAAATNLSSSLKHQHQIQAPPQITTASKDTEKLMEIEKLRKKLEDTEKAMAKLIAEMNSDQYEAKKNSNENSTTNQQQKENISNGHANIQETTSTGDDSKVDETEHKKSEEATDDKRKKREGSADRTVSVLGMEVTASVEGGHKWSGRPPTPVLSHHHEHSKSEDDKPEPQSIYLEGSLAHDSQILVSDSEIKQEEVYDAELNGSAEEPAVILSSKMTLSLINLDNKTELKKPTSPEVESPLADDIEIIGHDLN
ncbi:resistance to inhibitors of cholinesterase protein 3 isoform X5 [Musca domestica]|uniref:Resistance to inhibitors of cholinesterase protein 3 isoform X5 n=1 Tax=Musca domestica TaxID=7370 RepID=A0A1I8N4J7_MUSDO|nr:resistance to inhibitors of cholinesterase protein 3 isoform X5 [Musca domestica]